MNRQEQILDWIRTGLQRYSAELAGYRVLLFGSRACGTHRDRSDFDLGIVGDKPVALSTYYRIGEWLEGLPTLYRIDWVDLNRASDAVREDAVQHAVVIHG